MNKVLNFEFRKLLHSPIFYFCILAIVMGNVMNTVVYKLIDMVAMNNVVNETMNGMGLDVMMVTVTGANMFVTAFSNSSLITIISIFVALFMCEDFSNNTIKNIIARGYTRNNVIVSKLFSTMIAVFIMTIVALVTGFLSGWLIGKAVGDWSAKLLLYSMGYILSAIAYTAIYASISMMFRKAAPSIAVTLLSSSFVPLILKALSNIFEIENFDLELILLSNATMATLKTTYNWHDLSSLLICASIYLIIGVISCIWLFRKKDI